METIDEATIRTLYAAGGFLGRAPLGYWWCYDAQHQPGTVRQVQPDVPTALAVAGVLVPAGRDDFAGITRYTLVPTQLQAIVENQ